MLISLSYVGTRSFVPIVLIKSSCLHIHIMGEGVEIEDHIILVLWVAVSRFNPYSYFSMKLYHRQQSINLSLVFP